MAAGAMAAPTAAFAVDGPAVLSDPTFSAGAYIVTLREPSAAAYQGGTPGLARTAAPEGTKLDARSAAVETYSDHLVATQTEVADSVDADVMSHLSVTTNAFSAELTAAQAKELAADPKVAAVNANQMYHLTAVPSTEFLGLENADGSPGVWDQIPGGRDRAGEGVVVGIIDSGIAAGNASFAGDPLGAAPSTTQPYLAGDDVTFTKSDGGTFTGECETGVQFDASDCNTKLISARYYVDGFGATKIGTEEQGEYLSPRDGNGHGSHTASTAAGNADVEVTINDRDFGTISGVAPAAKIAAYKVCWDGPDRGSADDDGCAGIDLVNAIEQATVDGVDVINYSIGGGAADTTYSYTDQAFLGAAQAGVFVAASAGNSGPGASTLDNASPWITTVAASTIPSYDATVSIAPADGPAVNYLGGSTSLSADPEGITAPFVEAVQVKTAAAAADRAVICDAGTLDPALVEGTIVLCDRGVTDRTAKSAEVERAGGVGMVLVNPAPSSVDVDAHSVPTVHVDAGAGNANYIALHAAAQPGTAEVTLVDGNPTGLQEPATPQVAGFSSRGPVEADGSNVLKPDISAPGVAILADGANAQGEPGTYEFLSGTSMSSPHVAGLAALFFGTTMHPDWSPAKVKSAMMTTAYDTVDAAGAPVEDVFAQGAGHVDPTEFFTPGLVYESGSADWQDYIDSLSTPEGPSSDLNLPSISIGALAGSETVTRTVTAEAAGTYAATVPSIAGVDTVVAPTTLTLAEGESASYTVTFTSNDDVVLNEFSSGYLTWTSSDDAVRSPVAVRPVLLGAAPEISGTGVSGSASVDVTAGDDLSLPLSTQGLALGTSATSTGDAEDDATNVFTTPLTVPEGIAHARLVLDSSDDAADLDLILYTTDADGAADEVYGVAATGAADEQLDIEDIDAGTYLVEVDYYSTDGPTESTVTSYLVPAAAQTADADQAFTVDPAQLVADLGAVTPVTASWTGLEYDQTYLGRILYGDTGQVTYVTVAAGPAPVVPVDPTDPPTDPTVPPTDPTDPGAPGAGGGPGAGTQPGSGPAASGPLAYTGSDLASPALIGLALLLAGVAAAVVGRRRQLRTADRASVSESSGSTE